MIELKNLSKKFIVNNEEVVALDDVSLTINDKDIYGIIGMSGAGKSTLVRCINLLEKPSSGDVLINGESILALNKKELREKRRKITMIFQGFNLLMQKNCIENICLPLKLAKVGKKDRLKRAYELLELVGLSDKAKAYPAMLSGGQMQRIAIARALATDPDILLCDEATSALDPKTTKSILELIKDINNKLGITVIIITHQMSVVEDACNKVAILDEGRVVEQGVVDEVFAHPKSDAAKKLVYPSIESLEFDTSNSNLLRVVFNGSESTKTPIITKMAVEINVIASILSAQTKTISDKIYGNMIFSLNSKDDLDKAYEYLRSIDDIYVEVV